MKFSTIASLAVVGLATAEKVDSPGFRLVLSSSNKDLDGRPVYSCHSGAGINSLCILEQATSPGSVLYLNYREEAKPSLPGWSVSGVITSTLNTTPPIHQMLHLQNDYTTNLATSVLDPTANNLELISFNDVSNEMALLIYSNGDSKVHPYNRWTVCKNFPLGYYQTTLNFVLGTGEPTVSGCSSVTVKRVFA